MKIMGNEEWDTTGVNLYSKFRKTFRLGVWWFQKITEVYVLVNKMLNTMRNPIFCNGQDDVERKEIRFFGV